MKIRKHLLISAFDLKLHFITQLKSTHMFLVDVSGIGLYMDLQWSDTDVGSDTDSRGQVIVCRN